VGRGLPLHYLGGWGSWPYASLTHSLEEEKLLQAKAYDSMLGKMIPPS